VTDVLADADEATAEALSTTLTISGLTGTHTVTVYGESRTLTATNGVFTDNFDPYEVHLYQLDTGPGVPIQFSGDVKVVHGNIQ
jgi:hypothetical protein